MNKNRIALGGVALPVTAAADSPWDRNPTQVHAQVAPANTAGIQAVAPDNSPRD